MKSKAKSFNVVGNLMQETGSNVFEFCLSGTDGLVLPVFFKSGRPEFSFFQSKIVKITDLKLKNSEVFVLNSSKKTQVQNVELSESSNFLPKRSHELKDQLSQVLVICLKNYAISTETGVKFEMKTLLEISEKVIFQGILLSSEVSSSHSGLGQTLVFRDSLTNDKIRVYITYQKSENSKTFMNSLQKFSTFEVHANRMISKNLEIYSRLVLNNDHSNLKLLKTHESPCCQLECPCKIAKGRFSPNYSEFTFIQQIKPFLLVRNVLKLFLRPLFLNFVLCREICGACQERFRNERKCCEFSSSVFTLNASFIAEDSSGLAECFVSKLEDLQAFFGFNDETLQDFQEILAGQSERVVRYSDFTERIKRNLKNLSPRLKYCIGKVKVKAKDTPLVSLNSDYPGNDINFKILKVLE